MRRSAVAVLVLVVLGACSIRGDGTPSASDYRRAIGEALQLDRGDASLHLGAEQADCAAGRITDAIAPDRLQDLDVGSGSDLTRLDLTSAERAVVFDALRACVDLADQVADSVARDAGLPGDVARCVADRYVGTDTFRDALLSAELDAELRDRIDAALAAALTACTSEPTPV